MGSMIRCDDSDTGHGFEETISLLQEEVARLEEELLLRDQEAHASTGPRLDREPGPREEVAGRKVIELTAELSERDQMIAALWDQIARLEEAEAAGRAEWEQLHRWVEEIEHRVETTSGLDMRSELDLERDRADQTRRELEAERRRWEAQRRGLEAEVAGLRTRLQSSGPARTGDGLTDPRLLARLAASEAAAASVEALTEQLHQAQASLEGTHTELEQTRAEVRRLQDELERVRREHEVELAAARSGSAREALRPADRELSPDDRVRALRQHLLEIHDREQETRQDQHLTGRLSRLWRKTGPGR